MFSVSLTIHCRALPDVTRRARVHVVFLLVPARSLTGGPDLVGSTLQLRVRARECPPPLVGVLVIHGRAIPRGSRPTQAPAAVLPRAVLRVPRHAEAVQHAVQTILELRVDGAARLAALAGGRVDIGADDPAVIEVGCLLRPSSPRLWGQTHQTKPKLGPAGDARR